jgi:hypothetical protein
MAMKVIASPKPGPDACRSAGEHTLRIVRSEDIESGLHDLADSAGIRLGQLRRANRQRRDQTGQGQAAEPASRPG